MDLLQMIEGRRFLGREFLVFLWFESELCEANLSATGIGGFELLLEKQITLEVGKKDKEQSKLRGAQPSTTPEAREALRQGKLPATAQIRVRRGEQEFVFLYNADQHSLSSVKIPQLLKDKEDEPFYERIGMIEDLEALLDGLYADFLLLRAAPAWASLVMPAVLRWSRDETPVDVAVYVETRAQALAHARGKPAGGKRPKAAAERVDQPNAA